MKRIRFFSPFCSEEEVIRQYSEICEVAKDPNYGKTYCFTTDDDYTHAVLLNHATPDINISKKRVIGIALEPPEFMGARYNGITQDFIEYAQKKIGRYYIGSTDYVDQYGNRRVLGEPFIPYYGFLWHTFQSNIERPIVKTKKMSIIFSKKVFAFGHAYRHKLVSRILQSDLPIDVWGRGCDIIPGTIRNDPRIKGQFNDKEPYLDYQYHIAIENYRHHSYVSEKFTNCLVCECTPVYFGATKIDDYFPNACFKLTGNIDVDWKLLEALCSGRMDGIKKNLEYPEKMKLTNHINDL